MITARAAQKLKRKKQIVVTMYAIGFSLLAITTYTFSYKIPQLNEEISSLRTEARRSLFSNIEFNLQQHNIQMLCALHDILSEVNPQSIRLKPFSDKIADYQRTLLKHTFHELTGYYPDDKNLQSWASMNPKQLDDELFHLHLDKSDEITKVDGDLVGVYKKNSSKHILDLETTKNAWTFWSILLQIIGLAINQLAIILQMSWNP